MNEDLAKLLLELLPGQRRRRWLAFLVSHPELDQEGWQGRVTFQVKGPGESGHAFINQDRSWDLGMSS